MSVQIIISKWNTDWKVRGNIAVRSLVSERTCCIAAGDLLPRIFTE